MKALQIAGLGMAAALCMSAAAQAHHSFAMFDANKLITLKGTVRSWEATNPHSFLELAVAGPNGEVQNWSVELGAIGTIERHGLTQDTFKPADKVTVVVHPMKSGAPEGSFVSATLASGKVLEIGAAG